MTAVARPSPRPVQAQPPVPGPDTFLTPGSDVTLVEQIVAWW